MSMLSVRGEVNITDRVKTEASQLEQVRELTEGACYHKGRVVCGNAANISFCNQLTIPLAPPPLTTVL